MQYTKETYPDIFHMTCEPEKEIIPFRPVVVEPVSYTHLDVYKRQALEIMLDVVEAVNCWRTSHELEILIADPRGEFQSAMSKMCIRDRTCSEPYARKERKSLC